MTIGNMKVGGENLAWFSNMTNALNYWIDKEKAMYESGVRDINKIGHYINFINPNFKTVGLGQSDKTQSAEFSSINIVDNTRSPYTGANLQKLEVPYNLVTSITLTPVSKSIQVGQSTSVNLSVVIKGIPCNAYSGFILTSLNPNIITISGYKLVAKSAGTATISTKVNGLLKSFTITVTKVPQVSTFSAPQNVKITNLNTDATISRSTVSGAKSYQVFEDINGKNVLVGQSTVNSFKI